MDLKEWDDEADSENEDRESYEPVGGRDGLIFLIDATKPMFSKDESSESPFGISLQCCKTTMLNKIVSSDRDLVGVILFGTNKTSNVLNVPHVVVLQELQELNAEKIKQLLNMLKQQDFDDFTNKYGHSDDFAMSDALWLCQSAFSSSQYKLSSKRILLFTNTDNPHAGSQHKQYQARSKAADLGQVDVDVELLHIGSNFDPLLFYKELIQTVKGDDSDEWRLPNASTRFEELQARVYRKDHKKRSVGRILFSLGDGVKFGVSVYNLVRTMYVPKKVWLDRNTNEGVKTSVKKFDSRTGEIMLPSELNKYQEFGFKKITFRPDEVKNLRKLSGPGLKLLGFKPDSKIKVHHHLRPSSFIYPEEGLIQGSRKLFTALLDRCVERKVVPICSFTPRTNAVPSLVALLPQEEKLDDSNIQILPPGFHVVYLPYAEDIRTLNTESTAKADEEQISNARAVVKKLRFPYKPYTFDNPKLQVHWRNIEALVLDYDERPEVKDVTVPDHEYMSSKLGSLAQEFLDSVYIDDYIPGGKPKTVRKRETDTDSNKPKKVAKIADFGDMNDIASRGKVDTLKVPELKTYLQNAGIKVTGLKKAELVTKVYQHLGIDQPN
uniref:ATP-dependent DNA helicase 2 subunit 1 n=1 Tax=Reticulitermes speratus TaxID=60591 RepID=A0A2Z5TRK7_9NEOP